MEIVRGPGDGHDEWTHRNRVLAEALTLYELSTCDGCGQPVSESYDPDREGWYDVVEVVCAGCKAKESHARDNHAQPEPGLRLRVEANPDYKPHA